MSITINTNSGQLSFDKLPNSCPFCHKAITPNPLFGFNNGKKLEVFMHCPDANCQSTFIAYYNSNQFGGKYFYFKEKISQGKLKGREFSETINELSSMFVLIYNQAFLAEQQELTEICGVGYRKAIEFLIKDYSIKKNPNEKEAIEKKMLGKCINDYVEDNRIKSVVKRAVWLGNDETHYIRRWEGKNLNDLKKLIDLTIHWVEMEELTESFNNEMLE